MSPGRLWGESVPRWQTEPVPITNPLFYARDRTRPPSIWLTKPPAFFSVFWRPVGR